MASQDEVQRQLAELAARVDALSATVEALEKMHSAARQAANAGFTPGASSSTVSELPSAQLKRPDSSIPPDSRLAGPEKKGQRTLESRIGSQFLNRIGIFAVLIAAAWFLKLAFDRNWIGPGLRVALGIAIAACLVTWSERFRTRGFSAFSYTLKALGTSIAYLSLWAAWDLYHLLPAGMAFAAMLMVTVLNAVLAWRQDSELLALYALAGGLATPELLSAGSGKELFLFSYLFLLTAGALFLFATRPWKLLAISAFLGTVLYSAAFSIRFYESSAFSITLVFVALFFLAFASVAFLYQRKAGRADLLFLVAFPIANGAVAFIALMSLFANSNHASLRPWAIFALSAVFWLLAAPGLRDLPDLVASVHLGLALLFLVIAIPLKFQGCIVALCWLGIALALVIWASAGVQAAPRIFGAAIFTLAALEVLFLERVAPAQHPVPLILNEHFATYLVAGCVFAGVARLSLGALSRIPAIDPGLPPRFSFPFIFGSWNYLAALSVILFSLTVLLAVGLEVHHFWFCGAPLFYDFCGGGAPSARRAVLAGLSYSVWFMLYGAALMAAGFLRHSAFLRWQALLLLGFSIAKVFLLDASHLSQGYRVLSFLALGILLLVVSFAYQKDWLALSSRARR